MADVKPSFFEAPSIAIITGASKGIGRALAIEFAKRFEDKLHLVLTGRSEKDLQETISLIRGNNKYSPDKTTVKLVLGDLINQAEFPSLVESLFGDIDHMKYQHAVLINNAGSTGDVTRFTRDFSPSDSVGIQDYFFLNVTTPLLLASKFLSTFPTNNPGNKTRGPIRRTIVQITSLMAISPQPSCSSYCTGKAARDMLHKVIAVEEPDVRVLSYAPGPVDTAMLHHLKDNTASPSTAKMMAACHEVAVTPEKTTHVLCDVLKKDTYESGEHIDLFDIIGPPESE